MYWNGRRIARRRLVISSGASEVDGVFIAVWIFDKAGVDRCSSDQLSALNFHQRPPLYSENLIGLLSHLARVGCHDQGFARVTGEFKE